MTVPKLYKIVYAKTEGGIEARFQYSAKDAEIREWLRYNTNGRYYHSPGYLTEKFIEFEDIKEATLFALMWS